MKVWIDKKSSMVIGGKSVSYNDSFDEKKIDKGTLAVLIKSGKVGSKVVTEKEIVAASADVIKGIRKDHALEIDKITADNTSAVEKLVSEHDEYCATIRSEHVSEVEKLNADNVSAVEVLVSEHDAAYADVVAEKEASESASADAIKELTKEVAALKKAAK